MTATVTKPITAEELLKMGDIGRCELVRGEIVHMTPAGFEHGGYAGEFGFRVKMYVDKRKLGKVLAAETGFVLSRNPDTVRAPDVAFVRKGRVPRGRLRGFFEGAPDLAIEVLLPDDRMTEVNTKVNEWLAAGTRSVWVVDPLNQTVTIYRKDGQILRYSAADTIRDEPTLPGFTLKLQEIFNAD